ncbi:asparagine synthase (glutamine-hydrolyzing) [Elioraea rosea]|uniref:asparagine synthase (glutamine-hydrolyzing) n=1 Tax=Elioraea rosea TaxID=2492390 RepID=UPI001183726B|nr:asparagine synthase (glutamine-hydrolyzing) [Elioraea rosea]
MCGIAGLLLPGGAPHGELTRRVTAMTRALAHRGPDGEKIWADAEAGIAFGHRRLAIIDLSERGAQPMPSACGRYVITYNGEIYNHAELRRGLEARGETFRGGSDTEVLLALIARDGLAAALDAANGMFALALWDRGRRSLSLARDRFGQKPLAYGWNGQAFLFSSELGALEADDGFAGHPDRDAIATMVVTGTVPAPLCAYAGIRKLPPGTLLTLAGDAPAGTMPLPRAWWSANETVASARAAPFTGSAEDAEERLAALIDDAVRLCRVADVPLGAFLSGGIDSSTVVAAMRGDGAARSFTIGFAEKGFDEAPHAEAVARHLGTDHTTLTATEQEALAIVPELGRLYDEPFGDSSQVPTVLVSRLARRHVTVALSGDGGDEMFGGYDRYGWLARLSALADRVPGPVRPLAAGAGRVMRRIRPASRFARALAMLDARSPGDLYARLMATGAEAAALLPGATPATATPWPNLPLRRAAMLHDTLAYLPDDILAKVDRASMSVALETRVPLLDHRILSFAASLPDAMLWDQRGGKAILRRVAERRIPRALLDRPKMGFGVPLARWLAGPLRDWAEALLTPARLSGVLGFDVSRVRALWTRLLGGERTAAPTIWCVLMVQAWLGARPGAAQP